MIVCCEECGARNTISAEKLADQEGRLRCRQCNDFLMIRRKTDNSIPECPDAPSPLSRLILKYEDVMVQHKGPGHRLTMGRQDGNDLRVTDHHVSRTHAVIEFVNGKYLLRDTSLNGTYVLIQNRQGVTLKNDSMTLINQGLIGLGCKVDSQSANAISFMIGTLDQQSL